MDSDTFFGFVIGFAAGLFVSIVLFMSGVVAIA